MNDPLKVTAWAIAAISLNSVEVWVKILSAVLPAGFAVAYTIWRWRRDLKK